MIQELWKYNRITILLALTTVAFYISFAFTSRTDVIKIIGLWSALFYLSYKLIKINASQTSLLAGLALLFRILFLVAIPNLSQDFYRFIWDGRMLISGFNPYLYLPKDLIAQNTAPIAEALELYDGMGQLNASHYTNYPPISQLCYSIAGLISNTNILGAVVTLRILIILADIGTFIYGHKLLKDLGLPEHRIFWYILNPFIILELTANLHFEGVMVFFIIWSLYLLHKGYWYWAAIALGLSVSVKLIPLLFLPLFFKKFIIQNQKISPFKGGLKLVGFYSLVLLTVVVSFAPFLSEAFLQNFTKTISLWFQNFEFNASIYYIVRWVGYQVVGWNIIGTAGKILPLIVIGILLGLTFFRKNTTTPQLITVLVLGICSYYFLSTTVHPWYIAVPLSLCIFTRYRFPLIWSAVIILSYTAYIHPEFRENLWMVALEYSIVFSIFIFEIIKSFSQPHKPTIFEHKF
ncbi:mannosyltransferase [Aquimarina rhabdastrellae]